jgi:S-DNA-T family DNA segregation ATPase FtsK/SpoIIIE
LKKSTAAPSPVPLWRQHLHYRLKEGALIAFGFLCLYLMMALLTYDQGDPGWSHTSSSMQVQNAAGRAGAFSADILFMVLGYFAYIFPLLLGVKAYQVFRQRHEPWQWSGWLFSWRMIGLVFLILAGAALAHLHFHSASGLPGSAGGVLGEVLGDLAKRALNVQGSTLLFIALFLFGLTVFTDLSWFKVMDTTGKITLDLFELFQSAINRWWTARNERKQMVAQLREVDMRIDEVVAPVAPDRREQAKAKERLIEREQVLTEHMTAREKHIPAVIAPAPARPPEPSKRVQKEKQAPLFVDSAVEGTLPPISILDPAEKSSSTIRPNPLPQWVTCWRSSSRNSASRSRWTRSIPAR